MSASKVTPIIETKKVVLGAIIKGFGNQTVEIRDYSHEPDPGTIIDKHDLMLMVNGRDTDVAYVRASDLVEALSLIGIPV
jgi:hypothetical protein